jgi:hypothetical protein
MEAFRLVNTPVMSDGHESALASVAAHRQCEASAKCEDEQFPSHLVKLFDSRWGAWRNVCLRGAGFPASHVLALSSVECAAMADRLIEAEDEEEQARADGVESLFQRMEGADEEKRAWLWKAVRDLKKGKQNGKWEAEAETVSVFGVLKAAQQRVKKAQEDTQKEYDASTRRLSEVIQELANSERLREAVIWQNREAFHSGLAQIFKNASAVKKRDSKRRQHEELVASYLQRYCVKNDTIGFFGPVGWAKLTNHGEAIVVRPGPKLLAERSVYFEMWGLEALAESLMKDRRLRPWIAPRPKSSIRVEGRTVYCPQSRPITLSPPQAAILEACDGDRTAWQIAAEINAEVGSPEFVYATLWELEESGLIEWNLGTCMTTHPERTLRRLLEKIADQELKAEAIGKLRRLEDARDEVAAAAGDPERLEAAMGRLEATFTSLTGKEPTRLAGQSYAGRTLVYEDCRRDLKMELGPEVWGRLGPPLSLLLESSSWFICEVAQSYRQAFDELYEELARKSGKKEVEFSEFWLSGPSLLENQGQRINWEIAPQFQQKWEEVLRINGTERRIEFTSQQLRERVEESFKARGPGLSFACYHNPDVMIAASNAEAIGRGDFQFVLGEVHVGANPIGAPLFIQQHENPQELFQAVELDIAETRLVPLIPKQWPDLTPRLLQSFVNAKDYRLEMEPGPYEVEREKVLKSGALVIDRQGEKLVARTRDGRLCFDLINVAAPAIGGQLMNNFKMAGPTPHTPRVKIDDLVVIRETWRFKAGDLWFAWEKEGWKRFVEARRWIAAYEIPRFVFVKAPMERKPVFVDFTSPLYVDWLARIVRRSAEAAEEAQVVITEMLPGLNELWLPDAEGQLYTSELRIIAIDMRAV